MENLGYGVNIPNDFPNIAVARDGECNCHDVQKWWSRMRPLMLEMSHAVDFNQLRIGDLQAAGSGGGGGTQTKFTTYQTYLPGPAGYVGAGAPTLPPTSFAAVAIPNVIVAAGDSYQWQAYASVQETGTGGTAWMRIVNLTDNVATPLQYGFSPGPADDAPLSIQITGTQGAGDILIPTAGTKTMMLEFGGTAPLVFTVQEMMFSGNIITP